MAKNVEKVIEDMYARLEAGRKAADNHLVKVSSLRHGDYFVSTQLGITVYGKVIEKTGNPEDDKSIEEGRQNGYIFGKCHSIYCPEGELGDTHVTQIVFKISQKIFERARVNKFRHARAVN